MSTFIKCMYFLLSALTVFVWAAAVFFFFLFRGMITDTQADGGTWVAAYFFATWLALIFYSVGHQWLTGKQ